MWYTKSFLIAFYAGLLVRWLYFGLLDQGSVGKQIAYANIGGAIVLFTALALLIGVPADLFSLLRRRRREAKSRELARR